MIDKENVQRIAKLARLGIGKKEEEKFQKELSSILDYFNLLKEVDVSGVEPTFHSTENFLIKGKGLMRKDEKRAQSEELSNKLMEAVPDKSGRHIKVKSVF